jgi:hypothetical protein
MLKRIGSYLRGVRRDESGNATVEFAIFAPFFVGLLAFSIEQGHIALRHSMMERGMDIAVREIRLGTGTAPTHDEIKEIVCSNALFVDNCSTSLRLEMVPSDPKAFDALDPQADCTDKEEPTKPVRQFTPGQQNQLMLLRTCFKYDPMFPDSLLGRSLSKDSSGQSAIIALSTFVQEPL